VSVLETLGFGPFFAAQLRPADAALRAGRAVADRGARLLVRFEEREALVTIPGRLKAARTLPVVGDFLLAGEGDEPPVVRILARRSALARNVAGRTTGEQVLAANVDVVFLVNPLDAGVNPRRLERTLAAVYAGSAVPAVLLTKPDLAEDPADALAEAGAAAPGVPVLAASGRTGEGIAAIRALLAGGRTGVFVGPSGAGKSTLVNALLGAEIQATAEVRAADGRGRHTTTGRRLFQLEGGGAVIDGPGIRELRLWDGGGVGEAFHDIAEIGAGCRFADCAHAGEPGCAVEAAASDGRLDPERLASFHKLGSEARAQEARHGGAEARAEKQRWRTVHKELRRFQKDRGR
jgi:ribosome biogenesis GTPase / thiamine phosphate phosphatase